MSMLNKRDSKSWRNWRGQAEQIISANGWNDDTACKQIMCCFGEEAREALGGFQPYLEGVPTVDPYTGQTHLVPQTYEQLLNRLESQVFIPRQTEAYHRMQLYNLRQRPNENAMDFANRFRIQFSLAKPWLKQKEGQVDADGTVYLLDRDKDLIYGWLAGLSNSRVQEKVRDMDPASLTEGVRIASQKEAAIYETNQVGRGGGPSRPLHLSEMSASDSGGFQGECFICGEVGHTGRNCPLKAKVEQYIRERSSGNRGRVTKKGSDALKAGAKGRRLQRQQPGKGRQGKAAPSLAEVQKENASVWDRLDKGGDDEKEEEPAGN